MGVMTVTHRVSVERNRLRFAAAHMATFSGDCEPLHGHNYELIIELDGELTAESWVWDFGDLKRATRALTEELDHKFLLQLDSRLLTISEEPDSWRITFRDRVYVFPRQDVAALPIDNTTAERLAEWFSGRLLTYLKQRGGENLRRLSVGVEEMPGQAGWYTVDV